MMPSVQIVVTSDVRSCNGDLRVEEGAVGTIRGYDRGYVYVVFDEGQTPYVKPDGSGRLSQKVPCLQVAECTSLLAT